MERYVNDERMYQAALLKVVMKLKTKKEKDFDGYLREVMTELRLDPESFRSYVSRNMETVLATLKVHER